MRWLREFRRKVRLSNWLFRNRQNLLDKGVEIYSFSFFLNKNKGAKNE